MEHYRATNREIIEEIAARCEQIFYEVHDSDKNPECVMGVLRGYENRLRNLAADMWEARLLFKYQKEAVFNSLNGRIGKDDYYLPRKDKEELEKMLKEVRERLGLPESLEYG